MTAHRIVSRCAELRPLLDLYAAALRCCVHFEHNDDSLFWDGGTMILRRVLVGALEVERGFRRLKGYEDMPALIARLQQNDATTSQTRVDAQQEAA